MKKDLKKLQKVTTNDLLKNPEQYENKENWVGIIAKEPESVMSPKKWNYVFKKLNMPSIYVSLGVGPENLKEIVSALRNAENLRGFNMAAYKEEIMPVLDEISDLAKSIGSVNLVIKKDSKLVGYNTDGLGEVSNLLDKQPDRNQPFMNSLSGKNILQIGCGGAGKAVAYSITQEMENGKFTLLNRTIEKAKKVANKIEKNQSDLEVDHGGEDEIPKKAKQADLIINATGKGAASHNLEPYSALAPAKGDMTESDIQQNNEKSLKLMKEIPKSTKFSDVVHAPKETILMKHARKTGHDAIGGAGMNTGQAVKGFVMTYPDLNVSVEKIIELMSEA